MQTQAAAPGMSPSPQVLALHLYRCKACSIAWFVPVELDCLGAAVCSCNNKTADSIGYYRVQVYPPQRIELPPLPTK